MVKTNVYQVLTHAGQPVGRRWPHILANMWIDYWSTSMVYVILG